MQYAKSSLYDQVRDFLLTGELYEVTATSGANLRKSRGSREPRGSKQSETMPNIFCRCRGLREPCGSKYLHM